MIFPVATVVALFFTFMLNIGNDITDYNSNSFEETAVYILGAIVGCLLVIASRLKDLLDLYKEKK